MTDVSKHYTEEEWEGDTGKHCRICLFVSRNSISVNNILEDKSEIIGLYVGGWLDLSHRHFFNLKSHLVRAVIALIKLMQKLMLLKI
jgi:hypothetical protein